MTRRIPTILRIKTIFIFFLTRLHRIYRKYDEKEETFFRNLLHLTELKRKVRAREHVESTFYILFIQIVRMNLDAGVESRELRFVTMV